MVGMVFVPSLRIRPVAKPMFGSSPSLTTVSSPVDTADKQISPPADVLKSQLLPTASIQKTPKADKTPMSVSEAMHRLPSSLKTMLNPIVNERTIPGLIPLTKSPNMGILEEASDILYECFVLTALQTGTLKETLINRAQNHLVANSVAAENLSESMALVTGWMSEGRAGAHEVNRLAQMTGMDNDMAEDLLSLTYLRIATLRMEGRFGQAQAKTRAQLKGEFWELMERLPEGIKKTMGTSIVSGGYQNMQQQFPDIVGKLTNVLQKTLGEEATPEIMHEFTRYKHFLRQGIRLSYLNHADMDYDKRKRTSKAVEALVEASLLRRIDATD